MRYEEFRVKERLYYPSTSSKNTELDISIFIKLFPFEVYTFTSWSTSVKSKVGKRIKEVITTNFF